MTYKKKIISIFLIFILLTASFLAGMEYDSAKKFNQDKSYYLNQLYSEIDSTVTLLSSVENWGNSVNADDKTNIYFKQLLHRMTNIKVLSEQTSFYIRDNNSSSVFHDIAQSFDFIYSGVEGGIISNDKLICNGFLKDGIISNNEIAFLNSLKIDLENIKKGMYSEKTKQENPDLSIAELSQLFKPFTDKYSFFNVSNTGMRN